MKTYLHAAALIFSAGAGFADPVEEVRPVLAILGIAALSTALAYLLFFRLLPSAGATNLSLVTFLIPVSATGPGALFLGESLRPQHIAGFGLICLGMLAIDGRILRGRGR